ncbi:MAG: hypothetical protein FGF50_10360 [Candidatus Brockarchaeota archaeon]|nr:hypothetical protein [Candidatus Brockarchaeota archaeon]
MEKGLTVKSIALTLLLTIFFFALMSVVTGMYTDKINTFFIHTQDGMNQLGDRLYTLWPWVAAGYYHRDRRAGPGELTEAATIIERASAA